MEKRALPEFTSDLEKRERIAVLAYIPVHMALLPMLLGSLAASGKIGEADATFLCYAVSVAFFLMFCFSFLRRDFDPLCDRPALCLSEVFSGYLTMWCLNFVVSFIILKLMPEAENPNNADVMELYALNRGSMRAATMFLAPIAEEIMFRAGIFGTMRKYSRTWAYVCSIALFSLSHVWAYALLDARNWLFILQYIPVSYLLARCYERTNSIWCSIFFHMLVNTVSINALDAIGKML